MMNERGRGRGGRGFPGHGHGPRRARRGDVRTAVLAILAEGPGHGYEVIQALEEKSGGRWRPSPGSVYPTLQQLEDEDLVRSEEREGKRVYEITDAGRAEAERRIEEGGTPWEDDGPDFRDNVKMLFVAYTQVIRAGTPAQAEQANEIIANARKAMYRLLADD
ncbi:MAG: PadR family transcriptional regulator [Actinomycetia bacterium]|nr:PadR family transcriptional regulator [Actinomycetes bacterium]